MRSRVTIPNEGTVDCRLHLRGCTGDPDIGNGESLEEVQEVMVLGVDIALRCVSGCGKDCSLGSLYGGEGASQVERSGSGTERQPAPWFQTTRQ